MKINKYVQLKRRNMPNLFIPTTFSKIHKKIFSAPQNIWTRNGQGNLVNKLIISNLEVLFLEFQNVKSTISIIKEVNCFLTGILIRIFKEFFQNSVSQIDKISRIVFPLAFALLNGCYWFNYLKVSARIDLNFESA